MGYTITNVPLKTGKYSNESALPLRSRRSGH